MGGRGRTPRTVTADRERMAKPPSTSSSPSGRQIMLIPRKANFAGSTRRERQRSARAIKWRTGCESGSATSNARLRLGPRPDRRSRRHPDLGRTRRVALTWSRSSALPHNRSTGAPYTGNRDRFSPMKPRHPPPGHLFRPEVTTQALFRKFMNPVTTACACTGLERMQEHDDVSGTRVRGKPSWGQLPRFISADGSWSGVVGR